MTRTPFAMVVVTALALVAGTAWIGGIGANSLAAGQISPPKAVESSSQGQQSPERSEDAQDSAPGTSSEPQTSALKAEEHAGERTAINGRARGAKNGDIRHQRRDTPAGKLLDRLELQNAGSERFTDPWLRTLKEIVDQGSEAVPELIEELDATESETMLRALGFTLRAIGDKRAIPALIRAFPKTLLPPGSDMGVESDDAALLKFAQQHDLDEGPREGRLYDVGRPIREIGGALQQLAGQRLGEEQLYHIFLNGTALQQQMKRNLFHEKAAEWARWWEARASLHVQDPAYKHVDLAAREIAVVEPPQPSARLKTDGGSTNWILQSVLDATSKGRVFLDFDTGRVSVLPEKWRLSGMIDQHLPEILKWAADEGFDLMGTEVAIGDGEKVFALQPIGMQVWELPENRWKAEFADVALQELKAEGRPSKKLLLHHDSETNAADPQAAASFLYVTRAGNPGLLFVGVEVRDDNLQPGRALVGDNELDPVHFYQGRRFGFNFLEELEDTSSLNAR